VQEGEEKIKKEKRRHWSQGSAKREGRKKEAAWKEGERGTEKKAQNKRSEGPQCREGGEGKNESRKESKKKGITN
jgi:hypothetical protein